MSDDCDDDECESDSNASQDDDDEDEDEAPSGLDAGGRDAGRGTSPTVDSGRRDSGANQGGTRDSGSTTSPSSDAATSDSSVAKVDAGGSKAPSGATLPPIEDYASPGPFETTTTANTGPESNYTIFRPDPLGEDGFLHPLITFGPGIITEASWYSALLSHLASHGFVTISVNSLFGGPGDPANLEAMKSGLDWLIAQNEESGDFQGKLAVDRAVGMGYSLGATASVQLSSHEAVVTTVAIHGHDAMGDPHGPVLLLTGTEDVIGSVRNTLSTLEEAPAVLMALPIGHLDVVGELALLAEISPSARYIAPITAWLRYWVNGDDEAKRFFWGADCEMCSSPWIPPEPNAKWEALAL